MTGVAYLLLKYSESAFNLVSERESLISGTLALSEGNSMSSTFFYPRIMQGNQAIIEMPG